MKNFVSAFNQLANLGQEAAEDLQKCLSSSSFHKGELLLKSGEICQEALFYRPRNGRKIFKLLKTKTFSSGAIVLYYEPTRQ